MDTSDIKLAEKLRRHDPEQFDTLVRMHLSFVLDLNTEDCDSEKNKTRASKWLFPPFTKKCKASSRGVMEGAPLTHEGICQVYQLITYLSQEKNISQEGIFRRSGALSRQQELKAMLNRGVSLQLDNAVFSVHDCASVLKGFLADLPEPLLSDAHYSAYSQIADLCGSNTNDERLLHALQLLLLLLPIENKILLYDVLQLLHLTASYEARNKMSADSLATLFTPHLLCPRKLSPEALHVNSQTLSGVIAFMIKKGAALFGIPPRLATDIRAYWAEKENQKSSPKINGKDDGPAASTVFSFVDRERSALAHESNPTQEGLAQLYRQIQALPESAKKRRLLKQLNKENSFSSKHTRSKSLGDSIRKHIFQKGCTKRPKHDSGHLPVFRSKSQEMLTSPLTPVNKVRCFHKSMDDYQLTPSLMGSPNKESDMAQCDINNSDYISSREPVPALPRTPSNSTTNPFLPITSTPAHNGCIRTPIGNDDSMSPITLSTQKMPKAMQETMMTPRSRKPVVVLSGSNICHLANVSSWEKSQLTKEIVKEEGVIEVETSRNEEEEDELEESSLTSIFKSYLFGRSLLTASPVDLSFCSRTSDFDTSSSCEDHYIGTHSLPPEEALSESLLYCLNGNQQTLTSSENSESSHVCELHIKPKHCLSTTSNSDLNISADENSSISIAKCYNHSKSDLAKLPIHETSL